MNNDDEQPQDIPKLPKVSQHLAKEPDKECFVPRVVSIGPYHHGKPGLESMEKLKIQIARDYVNKLGDQAEELSKRFEVLALQLKKYYTVDSTINFDNTDFTRMMFLDTCFLLNLGFIYSNMKIKDHEQLYLGRDLILLENQLPYELLNLLVVRESLVDLSNILMANMGLFRALTDYARQPSSNPESYTDSPMPVSFFELLWKQSVNFRTMPQNLNLVDDQKYLAFLRAPTRSATDLSFAGIRFEPSKLESFDDLRFRSGIISGILTVPSLSIGKFTKTRILNLVAYEESLDDTVIHYVTNYIWFLNTFIHHVDDVKLLRSAGVLCVTGLRSDEEVFQFINGIADELAHDRHFRHTQFFTVLSEIENYFGDRWKASVRTWIAEVKREHFKSPWTAIVVLGASFTILLTIIQTYFTAFPARNK